MKIPGGSSSTGLLLKALRKGYTLHYSLNDRTVEVIKWFVISLTNKRNEIFIQAEVFNLNQAMVHVHLENNGLARLISSA